MASAADLIRAVNLGYQTEAETLVKRGAKVAEGVSEEMHLDGGIARLLPKGTTALHVAAMGAHFDLLRFMIEHTKEVAPEDNNGATPLQLAMEAGRKNLSTRLRTNCMAVIKALLEWGSILRVADWPGLVVERDHPEWESDALVRTCPGEECGTKFGVVTRRHHCRGCGKVFCKNCAIMTEEFNERSCGYCRAVTSLWKGRILLNEDATKE